MMSQVGFLIVEKIEENRLCAELWNGANRIKLANHVHLYQNQKLVWRATSTSNHLYICHLFYNSIMRRKHVPNAPTEQQS